MLYSLPSPLLVLLDLLPLLTGKTRFAMRHFLLYNKDTTINKYDWKKEMDKMKRYSVVICGGGSTYTPDLMELLCVAQKDFPLRKVILYDIDKERQALVGEYGRVLFREYYDGVEFTYTTDKEEAFSDIDFAFVQIRAGGLKMRNFDEKIPYKYHCIGQETCGAGGLSYGIRSVTQMIQLIKDIRAFSAQAWIINYSNPAAIVAEATSRVFPEDKRLINICDMPTQIMDTYLPLVGKKRWEAEPRYFGLNHYGWFTGLIDKETGKDLLPDILDICKNKMPFARETIKAMYQGDKHWGGTFQEHLKMLEDYPYTIPSTYCLYYLYPDACYEHYNETFTRHDEIMAGRAARVEQYCRAVSKLGRMKGTEYDLSSHIHMGAGQVAEAVSSTIAYNDVHAAYLMELAISIINNRNDICLVMVKNNGIVPNLDPGMMLEAACRIGKEGVEPLHMGPAPAFEKGLLENQYACEKLLVDAVMEKSEQKLLQAFTVNRMIGDTGRAKKIIREFKKVNGTLWPEFT